MKPAYWIGILALLGAIVGYAIDKFVGWYGAIPGAVIGLIAGVIVYFLQKGKKK
jgi:F0F1-type ATP synthase assembly protein I